jgi:hypothetical protein
MKKLPQLILALSLGATIASAQTTTPPEGPRGGGRHGGPGHGGPGRFHNPVVRALDTDQNGELSATELTNAPAAIRTLDVNSDGTVSAEELHPARPADAPTPPADAPDRPHHAPQDGTTTDRPHPIDPVMLALDANADGALSSSEINNATASLLALDLNKDGKLTPDELRPLPPTTN